MAGKRAIEAMAEAMAERRARERAQREQRGRMASQQPVEKIVVSKDALVNPHLANQGAYEEGFMPDLSVQNQGKPRMVKVVRNLYPMLVDRWLAEGGTGFEEPQRRAIDHCRGLWACLGTQRLVANYAGSIGGGNGDGNEAEIFARAQLSEYQDEIPRAYWAVFENVVRFDMPAGRAGSHLAKHLPQQIASAKAVVGFVASKIGEWRGY